MGRIKNIYRCGKCGFEVRSSIMRKIDKCVGCGYDGQHMMWSGVVEEDN